MRRLLIFALLALAFVTALTVGAFKLLGWWAVIVVPVVAIVFIKFVAGRLLKRLFLMPFKAKGAALRGARVDVHSVSATQRPAPRVEEGEEAEEGDDDENRNRNFFLVELTVTPTGQSEGFSMWEPGELRLVRPGHDPENSEDPDVADVVALEIFQEGAWQTEEGMKYEGPQRLRLTAAVDPQVERLQCQYYFEVFGDVVLPRVIQGAAVAVAS